MLNRVKKTAMRIIVLALAFIMLLSTFGVVQVEAQSDYILTHDSITVNVSGSLHGSGLSLVVLDPLYLAFRIDSDDTQTNIGEILLARFTSMPPQLPPPAGWTSVDIYAFDTALIGWGSDVGNTYNDVIRNVNALPQGGYLATMIRRGVPYPVQVLPERSDLEIWWLNNVPMVQRSVSFGIFVQRTSSFVHIAGDTNVHNEDSSLAHSQTHLRLESGINPDTNLPIRADYFNHQVQSPAQDPTTIIVGRPGHDTVGLFNVTWSIYNAAGNVIAQSPTPVSANYTLYIETHPLLNPGGNSIFREGAVYTIKTQVVETHANTALWGTFELDGSIYSRSAARFVFGDPPDEPTPTPATFTIYKDLLLPPGTDMPTDPFHFDFTATFLPDEFWPPVSNSPTNVQLAPPPIRIPFTYCMYDDYATSVTVGGVTYSSIVQSTTIDLNAVNWPRPGIYTFRIAETPNSSGLHSTDGITMDYDPTLLYLVVHVVFPDGDFSRPLEVSFFGISHSRVPHPDYPNCPGIRDNLGNFTCECTPGIDYSAVENKPRNVTFTNYLRRPPANTYFEVEKRLAGDMANTDAEYAITVYLYEDYTRTTLLTLATGAGHPDAIYAYVYGYQRNATTGFVMPSEPKERVSRTRVTGLPHAANLRHGDTIRFNNIPVGTGFRVVEAYMPGYIQTASVVTGGGTATNVANPATGVSLVASGTITAMPPGTPPPAGGVFNHVTVTNTHDDTPPTGVFMQNVPFGLMVAMGAGAMGLVATVAIAYKKKK